MSNISSYDFMKKCIARASTTLAVNTVENHATSCVDWVTVSFVSACTVQDIFHLIGIDDLDNLEYKEGARYEFAGYNHTYNLGKIEVMHYENDEVGTLHWLLNLSGEAC